MIVHHPDPKRWDLDRLAETGAAEDLKLAEQGLTDWIDALDREDDQSLPRSRA